MSTKIEWTDESWNPVTGCTKISPGCKNCYAERMARRLAGRHGYPEAPHHFDVTLRPDRLEQPLGWRKPRMIFVCSMSDLFHEDVPWEIILWVYKTIKRTPQHTYQILTKRPKRMLALHPHIWGELPNVWLGVSVENSDYLWRVEELLKIPATVRFVSLEPLLGPVDISPYMPHPSRKSLDFGKMPNRGEGFTYPFTGLSWIIVGGESGPGARPMHPQWARDIRDQCQATGASFFFKQWGAWEPIDETGEKLREWVDKPDGFCWLHHEYGQPSMGGPYADPGWQMLERVGKKRAGCSLDGREVKEWPNFDTSQLL